MMGHVTVFKKFVLILEHCLKVSKGEDVLILHDETIQEGLRDLMSYAAAALGANPQSLGYVPARRLVMKEFGQFAGAWRFGEPAAKTVIGALREADSVVLLGSDLDILFSEGLRSALRTGKRMLGLPYLTTEEMFFRLLPDTVEEVQALQRVSKTYFNLLDKAKEARITSEKGTDIRMELGRYRTNCSSGVVEKGVGFVGGLEILPAGQVTRVPNPGTANGTVVIDRSMGAHEYSPLREPFTVRVEKGFVTEIEGGVEADRLRRFLAGLEDPNLFNLTELGIGVNPRCKFAGEAAPAEDTHTEGCVSVALGCDVHLGGEVKAKAHMDSTSFFPTLDMDGKVVVEKGRLLFKS
jgi:2,5-dihydroxypyridine 5,6-dioxygenase